MEKPASSSSASRRKRLPSVAAASVESLRFQSMVAGGLTKEQADALQKEIDGLETQLKQTYEALNKAGLTAHAKHLMTRYGEIANLFYSVANTPYEQVKEETANILKNLQNVLEADKSFDIDEVLVAAAGVKPPKEILNELAEKVQEQINIRGKNLSRIKESLQQFSTTKLGALIGGMATAGISKNAIAGMGMGIFLGAFSDKKQGTSLKGSKFSFQAAVAEKSFAPSVRLRKKNQPGQATPDVGAPPAPPPPGMPGGADLATPAGADGSAAGAGLGVGAGMAGSSPLTKTLVTSLNNLQRVTVNNRSILASINVHTRETKQLIAKLIGIQEDALQEAKYAREEAGLESRRRATTPTSTPPPTATPAGTDGAGGAPGSESPFGGGLTSFLLGQATRLVMAKIGGKLFGRLFSRKAGETAAKEAAEAAAKLAAKEAAEAAAKKAGKEVLEVGAEAVGKKVAETAAKNVGKEVLEAGIESAAKKGLGKTLAKAGVKGLAKSTPAIGLLTGLGFGAYRLAKGDMTGAALEVASGAASTFAPGVGIPATIAIEAALMARDINAASESPGPENPTPTPAPPAAPPPPAPVSMSPPAAAPASMPRPTSSATTTIPSSLANMATRSGKQKLLMPSGDVEEAIDKASKRVGVDKNIMMAMAKQESNFNPKAKAKTSSAAGLYQFINKTWSAMVGKYGKKFPELTKGKLDVDASAVAGALYIKENSAILQKNNIPITGTSIYAAHFLGPGGAVKLFNSDPSLQADSVFGDAARANEPIFYTKQGKARSIAEVQEVLFNKVGKFAELYAGALGNSFAPTSSMMTLPRMSTPTFSVRSAVSAVPMQSGDSMAQGRLTITPGLSKPPAMPITQPVVVNAPATTTVMNSSPMGGGQSAFIGQPGINNDTTISSFLRFVPSH